MPVSMIVGLVIDLDDAAEVARMLEDIRAIASRPPRTETRVEVRPSEPTRAAPIASTPAVPVEPKPSADAVAKIMAWLEARFGEAYDPYALPMRAWLIKRAKNPPSPTTRMSYLAALAELELLENKDHDEDNMIGWAWSRVLANFTSKAKVPLLDRIARPMRNGRQDAVYLLNPLGAAILRAAVDASSR